MKKCPHKCSLEHCPLDLTFAREEPSCGPKCNRLKAKKWYVKNYPKTKKADALRYELGITGIVLIRRQA